MSTFEQRNIPLTTLLKMVKRGEIQLPDFQRDWVWDDEKIRNLLASVSQLFPIGTFLWLVADKDDLQFRPRPIEGVKNAPDKCDKFLLDGQQRITALYNTIMGKDALFTMKKPGNSGKSKGTYWWYYIDMEKILNHEEPNRAETIKSMPEEKWTKELDLSTPEKEYQNKMFPVNKICDSTELTDWEDGFYSYWEGKWEDDRYKAVHNYLYSFKKKFINPFENSLLPVIELNQSLSKKQICTIFENINQNVQPLDAFDLLVAVYSSEDFPLRDDWEDRQKRLADSSSVLSNLDRVSFILTLALVHDPEIKGETKDILDLPYAAYRYWADKVEEGFKKAAKFLENEGISSFYDQQFRCLAAIYTYLDSQNKSDTGELKKLKQWYWCGVFGERYSQGKLYLFTKDFRMIKNWIDHQIDKSATQDSLKQAEHDMNSITTHKFDKEKLLAERNIKSTISKGIWALLMKNEAQDLLGDKLSNLISGDTKDIHHIFPKKWCQKYKIAEAKYDSIINKTPISSLKNRNIKDKAPSEYLKEFEKVLESKNHGKGESEMNKILATHLD